MNDTEIEKLWLQFEDIPVHEDEYGRVFIDDPFYIWPVNTNIDEIRHWFHTHHSKGVAYLIYGFNKELSKL